MTLLHLRVETTSLRNQSNNDKITNPSYVSVKRYMSEMNFPRNDYNKSVRHESVKYMGNKLPGYRSQWVARVQGKAIIFSVKNIFSEYPSLTISSKNNTVIKKRKYHSVKGLYGVWATEWEHPNYAYWEPNSTKIYFWSQSMVGLDTIGKLDNARDAFIIHRWDFKTNKITAARLNVFDSLN